MIILPEANSCGRFKVVVIKPSGKLHTLFTNLIVNNGLSRMGANSDFMNFCRAGSGNAPPSTTDTALQNQIGSVGSAVTVNGAQSAAPYYAYSRKTFTFPVGSVVGPLREVAVGWAATGNTIFSRALVRDLDGNIATVVVEAFDQLQVTYEHRYHPNLNDFQGTLQLTGPLAGTYQVLGRAAMVSTATYWAADAEQVNANRFAFTVYAGDIGGVTQQPTGLRTTLTLPNGVATGNSAVIPVTAENANLNLVGGIRSALLCMGNGAYQFQFTPPIPKDADTSLRLQFTHTWGRA